MKEFNIFREESIFRVDEFEFLVVKKYLQILMNYPDSLQSSCPEVLDKLYLFQDVWFLIQYGKQYKAAITDKDVTLKKVRLAFLEYLVTLEELELAKTLSEQERFIFCYRYLTELFDYSRKRVRQEAALQGIRGNYYGGMDQKDTGNEALQQKVIEDYYSEWFKEGYILAKFFQEKLTEVKLISSAMEDVCGICPNEQDHNTEHVIQAMMKADDLVEIAFWKKKFNAYGLSTLFEHNDELLPPIVVCAQQSDGMRPLLNTQIGLICAILVLSKEEARDFVFIPYAEQIGKELYCEKGQVMIAQYMNIVQQFLGGEGSPNYRQLLNIAFTMLKLSVTSFGGEIVLICDDKIEDYVPRDNEWQRAVQHYKENRNIRIIVLYSGERHKELSIWFADRIIFIDEFQTEMKVM